MLDQLRARTHCRIDLMTTFVKTVGQINDVTLAATEVIAELI